MAFVSGGGGLGGAAGNVPSAGSANIGVRIPALRAQVTFFSTLRILSVISRSNLFN